MGSEAATLFTSAKAAYDIAKAALLMHQQVDRDLALSKVVEALITVQADALDMQNKYQELLSVKDQLSAKIKDFESWQITEKNYQLFEPEVGIFVYSLIATEGSSTPAHWLCTNCWEHKIKSIIQKTFGDPYIEKYGCPRCKHEFKIKLGTPPPKKPLRMRIYPYIP